MEEEDSVTTPVSCAGPASYDAGTRGNHGANDLILAVT